MRVFKQIILKHEINKGHKNTDILIITKILKTEQDENEKKRLVSHFLLTDTDRHSALEPVLPSWKGKSIN